MYKFSVGWPKDLDKQHLCHILCGPNPYSLAELPVAHQPSSFLQRNGQQIGIFWWNWPLTVQYIPYSLTGFTVLTIKPTRCIISQIYFGMKLYVLDSSSAHHQEFFTVHTAMSRIPLESCLQTCMTYTIAMCIVKNSWWWTEELSETFGFSFQNKFEKLVHLKLKVK
jgi:hypothetical protein